MPESDPSSTDARRFYLSLRAGEVTGPFTRAEVDARVARGEVRATTPLCVEGSTQWQPASVVLFGMAVEAESDEQSIPATPAATPVAFASSGGDPNRRVRLAGPVIATVLSLVLCCLPLGAIPLVYAFLANAKYEAGDVEGGMRAERTVRGWMIAMWILLALSCVINAWLSYAMLDAVDEAFNQLTRMR
jgi:hypothetical protein